MTILAQIPTPSGTDPISLGIWLVLLLVFVLGAGSIGTWLNKDKDQKAKREDKEFEREDKQIDRTHELDKIVDQRLLDRLTYQDQQLKENKIEIDSLTDKYQKEFEKRVQFENRVGWLEAQMDVRKAELDDLKKRAQDCFAETTEQHKINESQKSEIARLNREVERLALLVDVLKQR